MINEENLALIMIRLLKYHQISHGDCQHIPEFLDKIGYYRYATWFMSFLNVLRNKTTVIV